MHTREEVTQETTSIGKGFDFVQTELMEQGRELLKRQQGWQLATARGGKSTGLAMT